MSKTSRFNYIKRGLAGVCAATMLTGLCAGTAFALPATGETSTQNGSLVADGTAESQVSLGKDNVTAQIGATVPTTLPVAVADGTFTAPTGAKITNTSPSYGVVVKSVVVVKDNSNLTLVESSKASLAANEMWMTIAAGSDTTNVIELGASTIATPSPLIWKMDNASAKEIDVTIKGNMGALSGGLLSGILDGTGNNLLKIKWTIAADL